ncbi:hypothetical protein CSV86_000445 [Pseudomonas putida CSV86]|uniref:Uncharacterized protein n=1 Tax=Pseudomonas bharatica CSV86 TaxID=1005395 RepID=L1LSE0_9PSED|nr:MULTISPECIES: hypothetical protein [Pseudomonas]MDG9883327.1 hypothetical protein [Pseudomonas sp. GD04058]NNJ13848.1 hypothetical protein [Pseudomonas bharatica CSV86]
MNVALGLLLKTALVMMVWFWNSLRLLALLLIVLLGALSVWKIVEVVRWPAPIRYFQDPYVCGQISGYVLRFSWEYVLYWPEYEGLSSWEPGFHKNKSGCDANLNALKLIASWPEMKPGVSTYRSTGFTYDFEGVSILVKPSSRAVTDMQRLLKLTLEGLTPEQRRGVEYINELGLFHVRGFGPMSREGVSDFYWSEQDGQIKHVAYCPWLPIQKRTAECNFRFFISELGAFSEIEFQFEKLEHWQEIVRASVDFLNEGLIGS